MIEIVHKSIVNDNSDSYSLKLILTPWWANYVLTDLFTISKSGSDIIIDYYRKFAVLESWREPNYYPEKLQKTFKYDASISEEDIFRLLMREIIKFFEENGLKRDFREYDLGDESIQRLGGQDDK